jgi:hypothetical protein
MNHRKVIFLISCVIEEIQSFYYKTYAFARIAQLHATDEQIDKLNGNMHEHAVHIQTLIQKIAD